MMTSYIVMCHHMSHVIIWRNERAII
ncbi:rCG48749 [Rattus norvegicus]|uniref:RCG48749 n=1 Tax=Rattus norvegicus TaxID=10116 RepID=A6IGY9_RAT|nr:rCG48749 [Rattus norvegicus]